MNISSNNKYKRKYKNLVLIEFIIIKNYHNIFIWKNQGQGVKNEKNQGQRVKNEKNKRRSIQKKKNVGKKPLFSVSNDQAHQVILLVRTHQ